MTDRTIAVGVTLKQFMCFEPITPVKKLEFHSFVVKWLY